MAEQSGISIFIIIIIQKYTLYLVCKNDLYNLKQVVPVQFIWVFTIVESTSLERD